MEALVESGRIVDFVLIFMVFEAAGLAVARRARGRGLALLDVIGHLSAGALLLLAVRSAAAGHDWRWTAAFLLASFPAHLLDLIRRWRRASELEG